MPQFGIKCSFNFLRAAPKDAGELQMVINFTKRKRLKYMISNVLVPTFMAAEEIWSKDCIEKLFKRC